MAKLPSSYNLSTNEVSGSQPWPIRFFMKFGVRDSQIAQYIAMGSAVVLLLASVYIYASFVTPAEMESISTEELEEMNQGLQ